MLVEHWIQSLKQFEEREGRNWGAAAARALVKKSG
jgi:hypothetical protein